jgi:small-conductance mechanosensitive channel
MNESFRDISLFAGIVSGSIFIYYFIFRFVRQFSRRKERHLPGLIRRHLFFPGLFLISSIVVASAFPLFKNSIPDQAFRGLLHFFIVCVIGTCGFFIIRFISFVQELTYLYYAKIKTADLKFRKVQTQFHLIRRMLTTLIVLGTIAGILMTFKEVKNLGTTLLASAGIVGIVLGFAAQRSLGTMFAGIQLAIAQPIRIGDIVVVENEFGTIGEINLTYVVLHSWDGRRLIVPINYFLEQTFECWTRVSPEVVAKVTIKADYTLPVDEIRAQFTSWLEESNLWDKRKSGLNVIGANDRTIDLRATMSAKDSDDAWDLQCFIREKMINWIRENYPGSLPKSRIVMEEKSISKWDGKEKKDGHLSEDLVQKI